MSRISRGIKHYRWEMQRWARRARKLAEAGKTGAANQCAQYRNISRHNYELLTCAK